ncbi:MAG: hypothetical protein ACR2O3_15505 [Rhizobiaceae bacterium]
MAGTFPSSLVPAFAKRRYEGPNVILIRFGGGVRRTETIDPQNTYAPFLRHVLANRGILVPNVTISQLNGVDTSHAEGTLNILTGRYLAYQDAGSKFLTDRLEPTQPTLFEYLRSEFDIPYHQALLVNGEDRPQEEFFTYGVHPHYGIAHRSELLSLHRFKLFKFANILKEGTASDAEILEAKTQYEKLLAVDNRDFAPRQSAKLEEFWSNWRTHYGDSGFKNPRGDRLLTALALRAISELKPRLLMINYQDPDYVHWGNASHYSRAIAIIDEGISQIVKATDSDPYYRGRTVFVITPDCGRDANPLLNIEFQHHFNTRSAHETWAVFVGPGIESGKILDKPFDQSSIAKTVGAIMDFHAREAEGPAISEIFT